MQKIKYLTLTVAVICASALGGCAAISTAIEHHDLNVQTKMSNTIFLPPGSDKDKIAYVQVKNTSDQQGLNIKGLVVSDLQAKGYSIVTDPTNAYEMVQVNILQAGETTQSGINSAMADGFGGVIGGAALWVHQFLTARWVVAQLAALLVVSGQRLLMRL